MSMSNGIGEFTRIGNYAIPTFAAFVAGALAVSGNPVAVPFALYTVASSQLAYAHRLFYLRHKKKHQDQRNLPPLVVVLILLLHVGLLIGLAWYLRCIDAI